MSLSCEPFSPQLTQFDSSSWSQAIIINATSFLFLSGFQTRAQAPASSHQPLLWCQQSSSKPGKGPSGLAPLPGLDGTGASPPTSEVCSWTLCKSGIKASAFGGSFPVLLHYFLAKLKDRGEPLCVLALLPIIYQSCFLFEVFQGLYPERGPLPCKGVISVQPLMFFFILLIYFLSSHLQRQCNE